MNPKDEQNLDFILGNFLPDIKKKYAAGSDEHSRNGSSLDDLTDSQLLEELGKEIVDLVSYFYTLKRVIARRKMTKVV